jgi:hypothetical protein
MWRFVEHRMIASVGSGDEAASQQRRTADKPIRKLPLTPPSFLANYKAIVIYMSHDACIRAVTC